MQFKAGIIDVTKNDKLGEAYITPRYNSKPINFLFNFLQATPVEPLPIVGSKTTSSSSVQYFNKNSKTEISMNNTEINFIGYSATGKIEKVNEISESIKNTKNNDKEKGNKKHLVNIIEENEDEYSDIEQAKLDKKEKEKQEIQEIQDKNDELLK